MRLNESEDQTIMHKITFNSSVESIKLLAVTNEACHLDVVTLTAGKKTQSIRFFILNYCVIYDDSDH